MLGSTGHANVRCLTVELSAPAISPKTAKFGWNSSIRDSGTTQIRVFDATLHCRRLFAVAARTHLFVGTSQTPLITALLGLQPIPRVISTNIFALKIKYKSQPFSPIVQFLSARKSRFKTIFRRCIPLNLLPGPSALRTLW